MQPSLIAQLVKNLPARQETQFSSIPGSGEGIGYPLQYSWASLVAQMVKESARQETWVQFLGWEDPLEEGMATHSSILAWRIPWTEEPGGPQSRGCKESDMTEATKHSTAHDCICVKSCLDHSSFLFTLSRAPLSHLCALANSVFLWPVLSMPLLTHHCLNIVQCLKPNICIQDFKTLRQNVPDNFQPLICQPLFRANLSCCSWGCMWRPVCAVRGLNF